MYSLFIDTHSNVIRLCLYENDDILDIKEIDSVMHHSDYLMPNIKDLLKNNNVDKKNLNEILVINGPGSFTGVRLGVTVAKMLAYTLNINIKMMTSLDMFANSNELSNKIVSISDVKGFYYAYYEDNNLVGDYMYLPKNDYLELIKDKEYLVIKNQVDYQKLKRIFNIQKIVNPHLVNPIYIKVIEALK